MTIRRPAPLKSSFMAASVIGFLVSIFYIPKYSMTWAMTFAIAFFCMFIAALIAMERASPDEQLKAR